MTTGLINNYTKTTEANWTCPWQLGTHSPFHDKEGIHGFKES